jgi:hypothetical protein
MPKSSSGTPFASDAMRHLGSTARALVGIVWVLSTFAPASQAQVNAFGFFQEAPVALQEVVFQWRVNGPVGNVDPFGVYDVELSSVVEPQLRVVGVSATNGTPQVGGGLFESVVHWSGTLCGPQAACPNVVEIEIRFVVEFSAQGTQLGPRANVRFLRQGNSGPAESRSFQNGLTAVTLLPQFPPEEHLRTSGARTLGKICGVNTAERLGSVLESADFDGDGFDDLAIGLPRRGVGGVAAAGAVCVLHGGPDPFSASSARTQFLHHGLPGVFGAAQESGSFGESLTAGDFDGDGFTDLAVGASFYNVGRAVDSGAVWVFHGGSLGLRTIGSRFLDQTGFPGEADQATQDRFGFSLAAGDIDADGLDDLIVGVPFEDVGNGAQLLADAGVVQVLHSFGSGSPLSRRITVTSAGPRAFPVSLRSRVETVEANDRFGWRVAAGNLTGSEADEWVASSPFEVLESESPGIAAGLVEVYALTPGGGAVVTHSKNPCEQSCQNGQRFGEALEVADVNGDPRPDLLISDRFAVQGASAAGRVVVFPLVVATAQPYVLHQDAPQAVAGVPSPGDLFGFAIAVGDFNGDGLNDFTAGVPGEEAGSEGDAGVVDVLYTPWSSSLSLGLGRIDQGAFPDDREAGDAFGSALAAGDFDGDGFADLAVGVPGEEVPGGAIDQGVVQVFFGGGGR